MLGFMAATVGLLIWIFFSAGDYMMAGFTCADRTTAVAACAAPVERRATIEIVIAMATWFMLVWLLFKTRTRA
jgi:hypothetical protein